MAEFVFNGNANIFSGAGSTFGTSNTAAQATALGQPATVAAATVNTVALNNDEQYLDSNLLTADRQIELLLWLSDLELRLPPYGDIN